MKPQQVVSKETWLEARKALLVKEKEFTRLRDELSQQRRDLPWVKVDKEYVFHGPDGPESLSELFAGRSQLLVYHFMYGPDWEEGCPSCSFWADHFDAMTIHLNHRDVTMLAISRGPLEQLEAYQRRMGWNFKWVSSSKTDFNYDYHVSFTPQELERGERYYNYQMGSQFPASEAPGVSVFYKDETGGIYHTYSCYARGLDMLNSTYHHLDLVPKGRDEADLPYPMAWVRRHDSYED